MFISWPFYMYVLCSLKWHFKKWNCLIVQSGTAYQISYHYTRESQNGNTPDSNTYMNFINTHLPGFTAPGIWLSPQCIILNAEFVVFLLPIYFSCTVIGWMSMVTRILQMVEVYGGGLEKLTCNQGWVKLYGNGWEVILVQCWEMIKVYDETW